MSEDFVAEGAEGAVVESVVESQGMAACRAESFCWVAAPVSVRV